LKNLNIKEFRTFKNLNTKLTLFARREEFSFLKFILKVGNLNNQMKSDNLNIEIDRILDKLLEVRGSKPGK